MSDAIETEELRDSIRQVLVDHRGDTWTIPGEEGRGIDRELWQKMAELGWLALSMPEECDGLGLGMSHLAVLYEELGRELAAVPALPTLVVAQAIAAWGAEAVRQEYLPRIAAGACIAAVALPTSQGALALAPDRTASGSLRHLLFADVADLIAVPVRVAGRTCLALIPTATAGIQVTPRPLVDLTRSSADVEFTSVEIDDSMMLDMSDVDWLALEDHAASGIASDAIGGAAAVFEITLEYFKTREQFGRAIGSFQALKARMADWKAELEAVTALSRHAAAQIDTDQAGASAAASGAKAYASRTYAQLAGDAVQMHGGIGFTWEHPCHLFLKRAKLGQQLFGSSTYHKERVARLAFAETTAREKSAPEPCAASVKGPEMSETNSQQAGLAGRVTEGQFRLLSRMPALSECKYPEVRDTIPAQVYTDPARYEAEVSRIFRAGPTIAAPSALLGEPNTYHQVKIANMPVLLTRNKAGQVKAFANVCRHRGMKLCTSERTEKAPRIVCPYHAWTYNLDGDLIGLPRSETFPGLPKSELGLLELPSVEAGGLIWVGLDADKTPDFSSVTGELAQDLDALELGSAYLYDYATFPVKANWKLVMDSMLDSYHVTRLHKDSLAQFSVDSENQIDRIGSHIRNAAHRGNFDPKLVSRSHDEMRRIMVFSYIGFPNGIIVVSPGYISLGVVRPIAVDEAAVDYYMLAREKPDTEKAEDRLRRSMELMARVFGEEDYWAAAMCHEGIASGAIKDVNLGGMEVQIRMFQDAVSERLGEI